MVIVCMRAVVSCRPTITNLKLLMFLSKFSQVETDNYRVESIR